MTAGSGKFLEIKALEDSRPEGVVFVKSGGGAVARETGRSAIDPLGPPYTFPSSRPFLKCSHRNLFISPVPKKQFRAPAPFHRRAGKDNPTRWIGISDPSIFLEGPIQNLTHHLFLKYTIQPTGNSSNYRRKSQFYSGTISPLSITYDDSKLVIIA